MSYKKSLAATVTLVALGLSAHAAEKERVIVKFTPGNGQAVKAMAQKAGAELKVDLRNHNAFAMEVPVQALKGLRNNPNIEYVEKDVKRQLLSTDLNTTEVEPWGISSVEGDIVGDSNAGNRTVCIIDSGYELSHSDLSSNNVSGTNDSGTGNWYEAGGSHGTHVAGTVAAVANGSGVVGVMPNGNINLHIIKVFNASGWGYSSDLIDAVDECVASGANVVSMSLGGSFSSQTERNGFANHYANGVLSIAAAGNDGNTAHSYPASYDGVVSVAAIDSGNQHANFSQRTNQVELSGPGEAVLSSVAGDGYLGQLDVGGVDYFDNGVVAHIFYNSSLSYDNGANAGSASGTLGVCSTSGTSYSCPDMTGKVCLVERAENQGDDTSSTENAYPDYRAAEACVDAGADGVVIYSNAARPGLQAPFMVDFNGLIDGIPTVSVDRATGLDLANQEGQSATISKSGGQDWEYYNGTSMATPHVSAVAALAWSYHTGCSATDVRAALQATAEDLDTSGRDDKTGYGLVKAQAAVDYLATQSCGSGGNQSPTSSFTYSCTDLACSFDGSGSSDSDGSIASYSWDFGDGNSASGSNPSHTYAASGSYTVTLTVTDDEGATNDSTQSVAVSDGSGNVAPVADYSYNCTDLGCSFDGSSSSDSDGSIASYSWDFGDGNSASGSNPSHTYAAGGTYTVTLTVTDDDGATDSTSQSVTVTEPSTGDLTLDASGYKVKGRHTIDLTWSGASSNDVDIYRNGSLLTTTSNSGSYTDATNNRGQGTYNYEVCESGTSTCSSEVTVTF